ncbi:MAG: RNA 2'-phosphotransferase [Chloroflexota bacterium]
MEKNLKRLSKFLAVVLRHSPEDFGITLDEQGYTAVDDVWQVIQEKYGSQYTLDDLERVIVGDQHGKKRYEIVGNQIRAMYGHSQAKVIYPAIQPPELLYHGTNPKAYNAIRKQGLKSLGRQYVHLTSNRKNALIVAKRQTNTPVMLIIHALDAHTAGIVFHQPEAEHYLALAIPAQFIEVEA